MRLKVPVYLYVVFGWLLAAKVALPQPRTRPRTEPLPLTVQQAKRGVFFVGPTPRPDSGLSADFPGNPRLTKIWSGSCQLILRPDASLLSPEPHLESMLQDDALPLHSFYRLRVPLEQINSFLFVPVFSEFVCCCCCLLLFAVAVCCANHHHGRLTDFEGAPRNHGKSGTFVLSSAGLCIRGGPL